MSDADELRAANPWQPIQEPLKLKILGKLMEEAGELISAASRCIIQGELGTEPVTGKFNLEWLEDEIADVQASIEHTVRCFALDRNRIGDRAMKKYNFLKQWHLL